MRPVDPSVVVARLVGDECRVAVERVAMVYICVPPNAPARIWIWIPRRAAQRRRAGRRGAGWPLLACGIAGRDHGARVQQLLVELILLIKRLVMLTLTQLQQIQLHLDLTLQFILKMMLNMQLYCSHLVKVTLHGFQEWVRLILVELE